MAAKLAARFGAGVGAIIGGMDDTTPPAGAGPDALLDEAHRFLDWASGQTEALDGTDASLWFVQGVVQSMARDTDESPSYRALKTVAYAVYIAELLASTCEGVRVAIDADGMTAHEVTAVGRAHLYVLSWVRSCLEDPEADNLVFKYAGALRDLGEHDRAAVLHGQLEEYRQYLASEPGD